MANLDLVITQNTTFESGPLTEAVYQSLSHVNKAKFNLYYSNATSFPLHWHESLEIIQSLGDHLSLTMGNRRYILNTGDIAIINSDEIHGTLPSNCGVTRRVLQIDTVYYTAYFKTLLNHKFVTTVLENHAGAEQGYLNLRLTEQLAEMQRENDRKSPGYDMAMEARVTDVLVLLLRNMETVVYSAEEKRQTRVNREKLAGVFRYVDQNYARNITLSDIAAVAQYSPYYFTRYFKASTGMPFAQYLRQYRIAKAITLLMSNDDSITNIAYKVGFGSVKTFNRIFKLSEGCSPSQYRKQLGHAAGKRL